MNAAAIRTVAVAHGWWPSNPILEEDPRDLVLRRNGWRLHVYHGDSGIDSLIAVRPDFSERVILLDDVIAFLKETTNA